MRDLILATIMFALMTIYLAIYSWNKVKKAEENNQNLSDEERSSFDFSESNGDLNYIHFKLIPNDFEIDY